jgi:hypothetical protein
MKTSIHHWYSPSYTPVNTNTSARHWYATSYTPLNTNTSARHCYVLPYTPLSTNKSTRHWARTRPHATDVPSYTPLSTNRSTHHWTRTPPHATDMFFHTRHWARTCPHATEHEHVRTPLMFLHARHWARTGPHATVRPHLSLLIARHCALLWMKLRDSMQAISHCLHATEHDPPLFVSHHQIGIPFYSYILIYQTFCICVWIFCSPSPSSLSARTVRSHNSNTLSPSTNTRSVLQYWANITQTKQ